MAYDSLFNSGKEMPEALVRKEPAPIDISSWFVSKEDAEKYAKGEEDTRKLYPTRYSGQIITCPVDTSTDSSDGWRPFIIKSGEKLIPVLVDSDRINLQKQIDDNQVAGVGFSTNTGILTITYGNKNTATTSAAIPGVKAASLSGNILTLTRTLETDPDLTIDLSALRLNGQVTDVKAVQNVITITVVDQNGASTKDYKITIPVFVTSVSLETEENGNKGDIRVEYSDGTVAYIPMPVDTNSGGTVTGIALNEDNTKLLISHSNKTDPDEVDLSGLGVGGVSDVIVEGVGTEAQSITVDGKKYTSFVDESARDDVHRVDSRVSESVHELMSVLTNNNSMLDMVNSDEIDVSYSNKCYAYKPLVSTVVEEGKQSVQLNNNVYMESWELEDLTSESTFTTDSTGAVNVSISSCEGDPGEYILKGIKIVDNSTNEDVPLPCYIPTYPEAETITEYLHQSVAGWILHQDSKQSGEGLVLQGNGSWGGLANKTYTNLSMHNTYKIRIEYNVESVGFNVKLVQGTEPGGSVVISSAWCSNTGVQEFKFVPGAKSITINFSGAGTGEAELACIKTITIVREVGKFPEEANIEGFIDKTYPVDGSWNSIGKSYIIPVTGGSSYLVEMDCSLIRTTDGDNCGVNYFIKHDGENVHYTYIKPDKNNTGTIYRRCCIIHTSSSSNLEIIFQNDGTKNEGQLYIKQIRIIKCQKSMHTSNKYSYLAPVAPVDSWISCPTGNLPLSVSYHTQSYSKGLVGIEQFELEPNHSYTLVTKITPVYPNPQYVDYITFNEYDKVSLVTSTTSITKSLRCGGPWAQTISSSDHCRMTLSSSRAYIKGICIFTNLSSNYEKRIIIKTNGSSTCRYDVKSKDKVIYIPTPELSGSPSWRSLEIIVTPTESILKQSLTVDKILFIGSTDAGRNSIKNKPFDVYGDKSVSMYNTLTAPLFNGSIDDGSLDLFIENKEEL